MSHILNGPVSGLNRWIRDEVDFPGTVQKGKRGITARRVQEWLCLHDFKLIVDSDFGDITEATVMEFQNAKGIQQSGAVDQSTWDALVAPMVNVLTPPQSTPRSFGQAVLSWAQVHLATHPREVGGQNMGPWVRLYMDGNEGRAWPWCAGFVTFLMDQAADLTGLTKPIRGSVSCDSLAEQGKNAGLFVSGSSGPPPNPPPCAIFLRRRTPTDWTHTGIVTDLSPTFFRTIEGNTNDEGHREGFEVCSRRQGYPDKDFIVL